MLLRFLPTYAHLVSRSLACSTQLQRHKEICTQKVSVDEDNIIDDEGLPRDFTVEKPCLLSRRLDNIICKATRNSMTNVEKLIASGNVRVNEQLVKKKAYNVEKDDEIDIWSSNYEENPKLVNIKRLKIHSLLIGPEGYKFVIKYWKNLLVYNWK